MDSVDRAVLAAQKNWPIFRRAAESTVRAHKTSDTADFEETLNLLEVMYGPPPILDELYLLGTEEPITRLGQIIASTDRLAQPFIQTKTM